jgi:prefoldin subunit 5
MDQSTAEQIMEFLKAIERKREANKEIMARMEAKLDSSQERTNANLEEMKATIRSGQEEMIKAITGASRE